MIVNIPGHIQMIRNGLAFRGAYVSPLGFIVKTQSRRPKRGIYHVEAERKKPHKIGYAVQRKRGVKAEPDIRIVFNRIWEEVVQAIYPGKPESYFKIISLGDAIAEGGYTPHDYERIFAKLNPNWNGEGRWAFEFHVIEVYTADEKEIYRKFDNAQKEVDKER